MEFEGSDDDIRGRFESYLFSFLVSAKLTLDPPDVAPVTPEALPPKPKDYTSDFNSTWVKMWQKTNNFKLWNEHTTGPQISSSGINPGHVKEVPSTISLVSARFQEFSWGSKETVGKAISTAAASAGTAVTTVAESPQAKNLQSGANSMLASMSGWMNSRKREWSTASSAKSGEAAAAPLVALNTSGEINTPGEINTQPELKIDPAAGPVAVQDSEPAQKSPLGEAFVEVQAADAVEAFEEIKM
ncbi:hypothetical protein HDU98_000538 [Podochytrium sp. JEL0797]|nr:hypothetical protein HDU98_000538 [Podochytrium sp. JEL0797]